MKSGIGFPALATACLLCAVGVPTGYATVENETIPGRLFAAANNAFASALYSQLADVDDNAFFSPFSVAAVLALAAEGARGETAEQMGRVLAYPQDMRTVGADAASTPWRMSVLHEDLAALSKQLGEGESPLPKRTSRRSTA